MFKSNESKLSKSSKTKFAQVGQILVSEEEKKFSNYFDLPNPGLRSYFDRVQKGQPDIYRTPFAKGKSVEQVLKEWAPHIQSISEKWPTLVNFENDLKAKVGPMSVMKPLKERMSDIDNYYDLINLDRKPVSQRALLAVVSEFKSIKGLSLRSQSKTNLIMKKSTNSGSPFFTTRKTVQDKTLPILGIHEMRSTVYQYLKDGTSTWLGCAVLGWRGQEGGPKPTDVKQRVVWMFPYAVNIKELQLYQPLIEACQANRLVPAWISMEAVDERITRMFDTKNPQDDIVCTDFSKFDQHFNDQCQRGAYFILDQLMDKSKESNNWLTDIFPIKYMIPLAYDYGKIRFGKHGMASGSGGTNADETILHRALQYEAAQNAGRRLNPNSQCLGDDGVLTYPGIKVEDVLRSYTSHGLEMNPDKQYVSKQDCVYLRRWHHQKYRVDGVCVGVYSTYRALGRLMEQERYYDPKIWSPKMVALRQLSIIENCKYHPLREEFAQFCMKRDKFRLGLDIPGFLDNIVKIAKQAIDQLPDFLGYTKTLQKSMNKTAEGIKDWWIVKYLQSQKSKH
nr:MAG: RNA-dependent RNA polymerase [Porcine picobirnavirus]